MASSKHFGWLCFVLVSLLFSPILVQAASDCTNNCWNDAVAHALRSVCAQHAANPSKCVCDSANYIIFYSCDQKCQLRGEWEGIEAHQLCGPRHELNLLRSAGEKRELDASVVEVLDSRHNNDPNELDVSAITRPTTLPSIGWCSVPGSPCWSKVVDAENQADEPEADATTPTPPAPTTLQTYGVPKGIDPEWTPPTGLGIPNVHNDKLGISVTPSADCTTASNGDTKCITRTVMPQTGPPTSVPVSAAALGIGSVTCKIIAVAALTSILILV